MKGFHKDATTAVRLSRFVPTALCLTICFLGGAIGSAWGQANRADDEQPFPFRQRILEYVLGDSIPPGVGIYYWPRLDSTYVEDGIRHLGTARNIDYLGARLSTVRENGGTHCVGITWQLGMSVLEEWATGQDSSGAIAGMTLDDMEEFIRRWFVKESGGGGLSPPEEEGAVYALESFGLGRSVSFQEAKAGDFVQFWRLDGSGHSCVFLHWVYDANGNIIGFHYWGSQPQTDGIGTDTEYFSPNEYALLPGRLLDRDRFYIVRLLPNS